MFKKIIAKIASCHSFLITAHVNLEGDALGSELAVYNLLCKLNKKAVIFNHDPTPPIYNFLPGVKVIKHKIGNENFDAAIVLDCSDPYRAGGVKDYLCRAQCIINIDHHISNTFFGDLNWVDAKASSACQMLHKLCRSFKALDRDIALCLYTGIFTDTGRFTYSNSTQDTHRIVSDLLRYGIEPQLVYENINSLCIPSDMNFIGKVISSLKFDARKNICWVTIKKWVETEHDLTEVIFSIMRLLKGVEVFVMFKQLKGGRVRVNLRSRSWVDVNKVAKFFGGGGHKRASGTTMDGTLASAEKKVISYIKRSTNKTIKINKKNGGKSI